MSSDRTVVSVYIITLNEERSIRRAIESVGWADEIVVLDSGSTDATCDIARQSGARVEMRTFEGFASQKSAAMNLCRGEWLLNIDADEEVTPELKASIQYIVNENDNTMEVYEVNRKTWYLGRWILHCGWYPEYRARLSRTGRASWRGGMIHEYLASDTSYARLEGHLLHRPYENLSNHLNKIARYADIWAREQAGQGSRTGWSDMLIRPLVRFVKMFILKGGFLDGLPGLAASVMGSFYVFMKYARLYEIAGKVNENI